MPRRAALELRLLGARLRILGVDGAGDLPLEEGGAELAVALEESRPLVVRGDHLRAWRDGGAAGEQQGAGHECGRPSHRRFSGWNTFRFLANCSSVISA